VLTNYFFYPSIKLLSPDFNTFIHVFNVLKTMDFKIKMTSFTGNMKGWEHWSKMHLRDFKEVLLGQEQVSKDGENLEFVKNMNDLAYK
jgi:hypothetical protein